jgi:FtsP/CotA-like multicopper oxidase with cupredoxin domain
MVRALKRALLAGIGLAALLGAAWIAVLWFQSRLPGTYNVMDYGVHEYGGQVPVVPATGGSHHAPGARSVSDLHGPAGKPDASFMLTASHANVRLASGYVVDALTFNGRSPGPELRVKHGDLVEVALVNEDVESGVTIHWHGVDVPNAEDGVAGVTQDAVLPGQRYIYRFRAEQVGTFWYHSHQVSAKEVRRGLFGALVIEPREPLRPGLMDLVVVAHDMEGRETLNGQDVPRNRKVAPGTPVRLRLVNTDNSPLRFSLTGTPFRVVAIDGADLHEPQPLENTTLEIAAGGRHDVEFIMPETPVALSIPDTDSLLGFSADGKSTPPVSDPGVEFDPLAYGRAAPVPFGPKSHFDREFALEIGRRPGFLDGRPGLHWTVNGDIFPDVPVFVVEEDDLVKVTIANDTSSVHPMHLHGHHLLVLSRDGRPSTGSPWWTDTLDVEPGERYELAFRADNPGIWMEHCHNLRHAAEGLTTHIVYARVTTPFNVGGGADNRPE